jgi:hypothetical protein
VSSGFRPAVLRRFWRLRGMAGWPHGPGAASGRSRPSDPRKGQTSPVAARQPSAEPPSIVDGIAAQLGVPLRRYGRGQHFGGQVSVSVGSRHMRAHEGTGGSRCPDRTNFCHGRSWPWPFPASIIGTGLAGAGRTGCAARFAGPVRPIRHGTPLGIVTSGGRCPDRALRLCSGAEPSPGGV